MSNPIEDAIPEAPSAAACAEAAAWIARLHGEDRTASVEAGFKRWLTAKEEHRAAFEMANEIWAETERLPKPKAPAFVRWPTVGLVVTLPRALIAMSLIAIAAVGIGVYLRDPGLVTRVGEQRNLTLADGSRVSLNTASRIHVQYDRSARRVVLDEGEAYFEVAKHADWPFVVTAGGRQVIAKGTAFLVRRDEDRVAVTLVEGKVTVIPTEEAAMPSHAPVPVGAQSSSVSPIASGADVTLFPGQRLTFVGRGSPKLDTPSLERMTAWQHGQAIFDHTSLADAVAEMNRYSGAEIKIERAEAGRTEVTGVFRLGESESFAEAVAEAYHLHVVVRGDEITLIGQPLGPGGTVMQK
jgi:transmembrane sensor